VVEHLRGPDDPRVAEYRGLADPELVRSRHLFIAEGRLVVRRLIETGRYAIRSLLLSEAAFNDLQPLLSGLASTVSVYLARIEDFQSITGYNIHRGCLALAVRPEPPSIDNLLCPARTVIVLEGVTNADNVGGVFRNAAAFGADAVLLSPTCCDPLYRKAIRTSMGAVLRIPFARLDPWPAGLSQLRSREFTLVALTPREPAEELHAFTAQPLPAKLALLIGTEGTGLTPAVESIADRRVRIPVRESVDSLNLAVAAGIALYGIGCGNRRQTPDNPRAR
jgi:tRNA G18 (ribose-2'-O)-methylase SpoU